MQVAIGVTRLSVVMCFLGRPDRKDIESSVPHPRLGDERMGESLNSANRPSQHGGFHTVVMAQVHMQGRYRQVVMAVRDRVLNLDLLPSLIAQSPQLWTSLQGAFEADLTLAEIVDLAVAASHIPTDQIASGSIDESCTVPWTTPGGAQVLLPLPDKIDDVVQDLILPKPTTASAK